MSILTEVELLDLEIDKLTRMSNDIHAYNNNCDLDCGSFAVYDVCDSIDALVSEKRIYRSSLVARAELDIQ